MTTVAACVTVSVTIGTTRDAAGRAGQTFRASAAIGYGLGCGTTQIKRILARFCGFEARSSGQNITAWYNRSERFSRPPPSTTRPSLRVEMSPQIARVLENKETSRACVTGSVTIGTIRDEAGPRDRNIVASTRPRGLCHADLFIGSERHRPVNRGDASEGCGGCR